MGIIFIYSLHWLFQYLGLTILSEAKYLAHQSEWMSTLGSSFSVKLDGMGQLLCLLTAISFPLIFIATWHSYV